MKYFADYIETFQWFGMKKMNIDNYLNRKYIKFIMKIPPNLHTLMLIRKKVSVYEMKF